MYVCVSAYYLHDIACCMHVCKRDLEDVLWELFECMDS